MQDTLRDARAAILRAQDSINIAKLMLDEGRLAGAVTTLENGAKSLRNASKLVDETRALDFLAPVTKGAHI